MSAIVSCVYYMYGEQSGFHELSHFSGLQTGQGSCRLKQQADQLLSQIFKAKREFLQVPFRTVISYLKP
jgi:hypothetical protein